MNIRTASRLLPALVIAGILTGLGGVRSAVAVVPLVSKIAYVSLVDGAGDVFVMDPDGANALNLTMQASMDGDPDWSPDGAKIAFVSTRTGDSDIYVMNADGTGVANVTLTPTVDEWNPSWSPDGAKIAFTADVNGFSDIFVMNADGTGVVNLTNTPDIGEWGPDWSPDGAQIVFSARDSVTNVADIFVMNADGTGVVNLTNTPDVEEWAPSWSPDGAKIAFASDAGFAVPNIHVMNPDGTGRTPLTEIPEGADAPTWSPDAMHIAFSMGTPLGVQIGAIDVDGTNLRILSPGPLDFDPAWSPLVPPPPPPGTLVYESDFEAGAGPEWSISSVTTAPVGENFLGEFTNETVQLGLTNLPTHSSVIVEFDLYVIRTWDGNDPFWGIDVWMLATLASGPLVRTTFTNFMSDQAFPGPPVARDALGYDLARGGDSIYHLVVKFPHSDPNVTFLFAGNGLQTVGDESWGIDNVAVYVSDDVAEPVLMPEPPTSVTATSAPGGAIVSWDPPPSTGSLPERYVVFADPAIEPGHVFSVPGTELSAHVIGLPADGTLYTYRVIAIDAMGNIAVSDLSNAVEALPIEATHQFVYNMPAGLSLFSMALAPVSMTNGVDVVDALPGVPLFASDLIALGSTVVIALEGSEFDTAVGRDGFLFFGHDFPIKPGRGYVVNLVEPMMWTLEGRPHGEPIGTNGGALMAPAPLVGQTWAFAVAGEVPDLDLLPEGATLRIVNGRTGDTIDVPIAENGRFAVAFTDPQQRSVVEQGDTLRFELLSPEGYRLTTFTRSIDRNDLRNAFVATRLTARPVTARLLQNYPNPFNPETWIPFELSEPADVTIHIYRLDGSLVRTLDVGHRPAGYHVSRSAAAYWDGRNAFGEPVASGVYIYELRAGDYRDARPMVIRK